jgi:hypothetical protein
MGAFSTAGKDALLNGLPNTIYAQAHSADPGTDGLTGALAGVARVGVTLGASSASAPGVRRPTGPGPYQFTIQAGQTIRWVSYWNSIGPGGVFLASDQLDQEEYYAGGGQYTLTVQDFTA